jgi:hypothetical protein
MSLPVIEKSAFWLHAAIATLALGVIVFLATGGFDAPKASHVLTASIITLVLARCLVEIGFGYVTHRRRTVLVSRRKVTVPTPRGGSGI